MVSHLNSFRYVEMDGEFIEAPCQHFEEVPQTVVATKIVSKVPKITRPPPKMAYLKDAKVGVPFGANSWIFPTNLTNLVWVLLQEPIKLFVVLVPRDHLCGSATMV